MSKTPAEREVALRALSDVLEESLSSALGSRVNFVLVMMEDDFYVSHMTNTPRELASRMLQAVYNGPPYQPS